MFRIKAVISYLAFRVLRPWNTYICHTGILTRQDPSKTSAPSGKIETIGVLYPANSQGAVWYSHLPTTETQPLAVRNTAAV